MEQSMIDKLIEQIRQIIRENGITADITSKILLGLQFTFNEWTELLSELERTQWISATDNPPDEMGIYDIVIGTDNVTIGFRFNGIDSWHNSEGMELGEDVVTYWKYRPRPPKER